MYLESQLKECRPALEALCRKHGVRRLSLFGSAIREDFHQGASDLDFLVEFDAPPTADSYFGLLEDLQELFHLPIDLLIESAIRNPYFRESVEKSKTSLYAA
jgi:uncharacterized protein